MPSAYIYTYKGFPGDKSDKYYVCKYGKGSPLTYQVVPQLQRIFDREGAQNKESLGWKRFKKLRRNGHLYTRKQADKKREPMYEAVAAQEVREPWGPLAAWLADEVAPGEVDWADLGASLRRAAERHPRVPESIWAVFGRFPTPTGQTLRQCWSQLRERHLRRCWPHLWPTASVATMAEAAPDDVGAEELLERLCQRRGEVDADKRRPDNVAATEYRLDTLRACGVGRSAPPRAFDEETWRAACLRETGLAGDASWQALLDALPPEGERFESVGAATDLPVELLYDLLWVLSERLDPETLASPWATTGRRGLHARWHAAATSAVVVELESLHGGVGCEELEACLAGQPAELPNPFAGWSDAGRRAFLELSTRGDGLPRSAPTTEALAEWGTGHLDRRIRERLDDLQDGAADWNYCRSGRHLVVSSRSEAAPERLMELRRRIARDVEAAGYATADNATRIWRRANGPLVLDGVRVPDERDGPIREPEVEWPEPAQVLERRRDDGLSEQVREELGRIYPVSGSLRFGALADEELGGLVDGLAGALAVSEFGGRVVDGWFACGDGF